MTNFEDRIRKRTNTYYVDMKGRQLARQRIEGEKFIYFIITLFIFSGLVLFGINMKVYGSTLIIFGIFLIVLYYKLRKRSHAK